MQRTNWLKEDLLAWAQWFETASGYSDSTVIGRAVGGQLSMCNYVSTIPLGAEPPRSLARLCYAMTDLKDTEHAQAVVVTQKVYRALIQPEDVMPEPYAHVAAEFGKSERTIYRLRGAGESAIRARLRSM